MLMLLLVISFTTAAGLVTNQNYTNADRKERALEAQYAFRAGLSTAMDKLTANPSWAPTETAPYEEFLSTDSRIGFRVWLDGINTSSATPLTSASGLMLERGQAALQVVALVNGKEMRSGFGGAESTPLLVCPTVQFANNILQQDPGNSLVLSPSASLLSYNSSAGVLPFTGLPTAPPADNQRASVRAMADIDLGGTKVYGEAILPTAASLSLGAGACNTQLRLDEAYLPRKFSPALSSSLVSPNPLAPVPPGDYSALSTPPGTTLTLARGGTYFFSDIYLGDSTVLQLSGPVSDGPCVIYTHTFDVENSSRINMPAAGVAPVPSELQIYGTPMTGCDIPSVRLGASTQAAFVTAGHNLRVTLEDHVKLYGAVIASELFIANQVEVHFDEALLGQPMAGTSQWVMVSQGMR